MYMIFSRLFDLYCCTIDGKFVAVSEKYKIIRIFDAQNGEQLGPNIEIHRTIIRSIHFSTDYLLASSDDDGTIRIWDMNSRLQIGDPLIQDIDRIRSVKFVNSSLLASIRWNINIISIWNIQTRDLIHQILAPSDALTIHCIPNTKYLISSNHSMIYVWRIGSFKKRTLKGKNTNLSTNISPNQKLIISSEESNTGIFRGRVRIQNSTTGKQVTKFHIPNVFQQFGITPDNQFVIYKCEYENFRLLNITNRMNTLFQIKDDPIYLILCDGRYVLKKNQDNTIDIQRIVDL